MNGNARFMQGVGKPDAQRNGPESMPSGCKSRVSLSYRLRLLFQVVQRDL